MKKRFANDVKKGINEYYQKRIDEEYFKGYISLVKNISIDRPWYVIDGGVSTCILDEKYEWLEIYPDDEKYAITAMFDNNHKLIEWYFDMIKNSGIEGKTPYINDLYLDLVIKPDGTEIVLDEDELEEALNKNDITKEDFNMAYETMKKIQNKYRKNIKELENLTKKLYQKF